MFFLVAGVQVGVVRLVGLDHSPQDFQQALAQAAQSAGMAFAFRAFLAVVNVRPRTNLGSTMSPKMDGVAQHFVALVAKMHPVDLAGLKADRGGSGDTLQRFGVREPPGIAADFAQQPRSQSLGHARERAKQVMVGMLLKETLNLLAVLIQLELQGVE